MSVDNCLWSKWSWENEEYVGYVSYSWTFYYWTLVHRGWFYSLVTLHERVGGDQVALQEIVDFNNFVRQCALQEMRFQGPKLTWCNKQWLQELILKLIEFYSMDRPSTCFLMWITMFCPKISLIIDHCWWIYASYCSQGKQCLNFLIILCIWWNCEEHLAGACTGLSYVVGCCEA